jgi:hypothetical protein
MGGGVLILVMVGVFAVLVIMVVLLGLFYPGSGAQQLGWEPTRSPELEAQNEVDDLEQMYAATNAKRRARGAAELDAAAIQKRLAEDAEIMAKLRGSDSGAEEEMRQLREAREFRAARRKAREENE